MSFLDDIGGQENDGTSIKEKPDTGSAGVASPDQLDSSGDENSTNEQSEEEQSSGDGVYGSD